jgi:hypothetical protein
MQKTHQDHAHSISNGLLNFATICVAPTKHMCTDFYFIMYWSHVSKTLGSGLIFVSETKDALKMEYDLNLLCYGLFKIPKTIII